MRISEILRLTAWALVFSCLLFGQLITNALAADIQIDLIPDIDQIGGQIETVQVYKDVNGERVMFGLYDTGASVVSISADDQDLFDLVGTPMVPILPSSEAVAQGIGGNLTGDVSKPGTILADGLHAFTLDMNNFDIGIDTSHAIAVPNIQAFVGTSIGSPSLPSITGTPIHSTGKAAKVDMLGYTLDFGEGLVINMPDLTFVTPGSAQAVLPTTTLTPTPVRIPLKLVGDNNYSNPGNNVTSSPNPVQNNVALHQGTNSATGKTFLFDTGAQMSIISPKLATDLGLDLNAPSVTIDVQGAGGTAISVPGFTIDSLDLPQIDAGNNPIADKLKLTQVPIFVLDLGVEGLDGILGMNLWNTAVGMLYDPSDPNNASVSLTFSDDPNRGLTQDQIDAALNMLIKLGGNYSFFSGALHSTKFATLPDIVPTSPVPEPTAWILLFMGAMGIWMHRLHRST